MGKLSEIAMELDDQAAELGFESYEDAVERGGYEIDYENARLWRPLDELNNAHQAWLNDKVVILDNLDAMREDIEELRETLARADYLKWIKTIRQTMDFIEEGEV